MPTSGFDINTSPNPTGINQPSGGTYGETAALDRLKAALPGPAGQGPQQPATAPTPQSLPPGLSRQAPGGLPPGLMAPSSRPGTPVGTPLDMGQPNPVVAAPDDRSKRLAILDALSRDPNVSEVTRDWASTLVKKLVSSSAR